MGTVEQGLQSLQKVFHLGVLFVLFVTVKLLNVCGHNILNK